MDSASFEYLYVIYLFFNWMEYVERSEKVGFKFIILLGLYVFTLQPNFITWSVAFYFSMLIIITLFEFLAMIKILLIYYCLLSHFSRYFICDLSYQARVDIFFTKSPGIEVKILFKNCVASTGFFCIVKSKFSDW